VVNVGAFGFTAAPVVLNCTLFGGTSYATPLTAGVAALVLQVLGRNADPALVKTVLQSSAVPLRYDVASQGFGRVDTFRTVSLARLWAGRTAARYELLVQSNSLWGAYASKYLSVAVAVVRQHKGLYVAVGWHGSPASVLLPADRRLFAR
jgi:subtilisin family serine protease